MNLSSPTSRLVFGFLAFNLVLCFAVGKRAEPSAIVTVKPTERVELVVAVEEDIVDFITMPLFSFAGLTSARKAPTL